MHLDIRVIDTTTGTHLSHARYLVCLKELGKRKKVDECLGYKYRVGERVKKDTRSFSGQLNAPKRLHPLKVTDNIPAGRPCQGQGGTNS